MRIERDNFYIFTGGPGSGKTSVIEALRVRGFACVTEVGRQIIQEQIAIGGDAFHTGDAVKYRDLMLSRSIYTYNQVVERSAQVFFDRGIPELAGYGRLIGADTPAYIDKAADLFRYNKRVFIMPPWQEIYCQDDERGQDFAEAVASYHVAAEAYPPFGYELVEVPKTSVSGRVDFVLASIGWKPEV
jgi:predicted ATPase